MLIVYLERLPLCGKGKSNGRLLVFDSSPVVEGCVVVLPVGGCSTETKTHVFNTMITQSLKTNESEFSGEGKTLGEGRNT